MSGVVLGDGFGSSLTFSGDGKTLAVSSPYHDRGGGRVTVYYKVDESNWEQRGQPIIGSGARENFGKSMTLSKDGSILAIGVPRNLKPDSGYRGRVVVYSWDGSLAIYKQIGKLDGDAADDRFGSSVSLSGNGLRLAVGASRYGTNLPGYARIYTWDDNASIYKQLGETIYGREASDSFGASISLSANGNKLGITSNYAGSNNIGFTIIFGWDAAASQYRNIAVLGEGSLDGDFGGIVSLSSDGMTVAVGAKRQRFGSGQVQVYTWNESESKYNMLGNPIIGQKSGDNLGISLCLTADGKALAIGASEQGGSSRGYVQVYELGESKLNAMGPIITGSVEGDHFGDALSLVSDGKTFTLAVGAPYNDENGNDTGQVTIYNRAAE